MERTLINYIDICNGFRGGGDAKLPQFLTGRGRGVKSAKFSDLELRRGEFLNKGIIFQNSRRSSEAIISDSLVTSNRAIGYFFPPVGQILFHISNMQ